MSDTSITPSIEVTIGRQTRLYHAFITTAPAALDAPSTVTLYTGPLKDIAGLAADDIALDAEEGWHAVAARAHRHHRTRMAARSVPREGASPGAPPIRPGRVRDLAAVALAAAADDAIGECLRPAPQPTHGGKTMTNISIHIQKTNGHAAPGKLADAEIHFNGGELDGLKLVGFAV
ncbi:MAG: hypothetical protein R2708_23495 [Vicinamibacterales bacterium]